MSGTTISQQADEAYRSLRSTVKFAARGKPVRSVLVVDIDRSETSGVAEHLARAFARGGDRCAFVTTDVRRGSQGAGLTDLMTGSATLDECVHAGDMTHLATVDSGTIDDPDLLAGESFDGALQALLAAHDYVILSCASLPKHADALSIAPRVDAVILVTTAGKTRRARAIESRDALERVGAPLFGVVMIEARRGGILSSLVPRW